MRVRAAVLVVAVLAGACGGGGSDEVEVGTVASATADVRSMRFRIALGPSPDDGSMEGLIDIDADVADVRYLDASGTETGRFVRVDGSSFMYSVELDEWTELPEPEPGTGGLDAFDPAAIVQRVLADAHGVEEIGTETVRGVETRVLRGRYDGISGSSDGTTEPIPGSFTMYVDEDMRLRRLIGEAVDPADEEVMFSDLELWDFGVDVDVTAPTLPTDG